MCFDQNQGMAIFPRCSGIRHHAWFPVKWTEMAMVVAVLSTMVKIRNLTCKAKCVLSQKIYYSYIGLVHNYTGIVTLAQILVLLNMNWLFKKTHTNYPDPEHFFHKSFVVSWVCMSGLNMKIITHNNLTKNTPLVSLKEWNVIVQKHIQHG